MGRALADLIGGPQLLAAERSGDSFNAPAAELYASRGS